MTSTLKLLLSLLLALLSTEVAACPTTVQRCGGSFAKFIVTDAKEVRVADVTIELIAELPREEYLKHKARKGYSEYSGFSFKLNLSEAEELQAHTVPSAKDTDSCNNPLKQRANSTRVRTPEDFLNQRDGSVKNFGFCTSEVFSRVYLLKISAPGYVTDYYMGRYLGGCWGSYSFVLTKLPDTKLNQSQKPTVDGSKEKIGRARVSTRPSLRSSATIPIQIRRSTDNRYARPENATA